MGKESHVKVTRIDANPGQERTNVAICLAPVETWQAAAADEDGLLMVSATIMDKDWNEYPRAARENLLRGLAEQVTITIMDVLRDQLPD